MADELNAGAQGKADDVSPARQASPRRRLRYAAHACVARAARPYQGRPDRPPCESDRRPALVKDRRGQPAAAELAEFVPRADPLVGDLDASPRLTRRRPDEEHGRPAAATGGDPTTSRRAQSVEAARSI